MPRIKDMTGKTFNRLTVLNITNEIEKSTGWVKWLCVCACGKEVVVSGANLRSGNSKSCGCLQKEKVTTHNLARTPEYRVWQFIKDRCHNKNNKNYKSYGARGTKVSREWRNDFKKFYEDMGPRPSPKCEIDRIDTRKGYSKNNCRWTSRKVNARNRIDSRIYICEGKMFESYKELATYLQVANSTAYKWCVNNLHGCTSYWKYPKG